MYNYYKDTIHGHIYRTKEIEFSDGDKSLKIQRWSFDFENWNGHIHDYNETRKRIEELKDMEILRDFKNAN